MSYFDETGFDHGYTGDAGLLATSYPVMDAGTAELAMSIDANLTSLDSLIEGTLSDLESSGHIVHAGGPFYEPGPSVTTPGEEMADFINGQFSGFGDIVDVALDSDAPFSADQIAWVDRAQGGMNTDAWGSLFDMNASIERSVDELHSILTYGNTQVDADGNMTTFNPHTGEWDEVYVYYGPAGPTLGTRP